MNKNEDNSILSFLCLKCIEKDVFITGCDLGYIYLWYDFEIIHKMASKVNSPVTCIAQSNTANFDFLSGNLDGLISYFRIIEHDQNLLLAKLYDFNLNELYPDLKNGFKLQIQSLLFTDEGQIIYGARNGDIGSINFEMEIE